MNSEFQTSCKQLPMKEQCDELSLANLFADQFQTRRRMLRIAGTFVLGMSNQIIRGLQQRLCTNTHTHTPAKGLKGNFSKDKCLKSVWHLRKMNIGNYYLWPRFGKWQTLSFQSAEFDGGQESRFRMHNCITEERFFLHLVEVNLWLAD